MFKKFSSILFLLLIFSSLFLSTAYAREEVSVNDFWYYTTYSWVNESSIRAEVYKDNTKKDLEGTFTFNRISSNPYSGTLGNTSELFNSDWMVFATEEIKIFNDHFTNTQSDIKTRMALKFLKNSEDRSNTYLYYYNGNMGTNSGWYEANPKGFNNKLCCVQNTNNAAEKEGKVQSGHIIGKVIPDKPADWSVTPKKVFEDSKTWVYLEDAGRNLIIKKHLEPEGDEWRYHDMPFNEIEGGGLYANSIYRLRLTNSDWGIATKSSWHATTSFKVDENGKVTILNTDTRVLTDSAKNGNLDTDTMTWQDGINIVVRESLTSPLTSALNSAIEWLADAINTTIEFFSGSIQSALDSANLEGVDDAWRTVRNITITLLLLGLLIIAFANVLSIDIEQYGAQRMIPKFVINIVLTYFSFLIVKFLLEVSSVLSTEFKNLLSGLGAKTVLITKDDIPTISGMDIVGNIGSILLLIAILIGLIIVMIYLFLVLLARIVMIKFLAIVGPVALILGIMPFTESLLKRWWSELFRWIFMGPAIMGTLLIGSIIISNTGATLKDNLGTSNNEFLDTFQTVFYIMTAAVAYFFAATIPTTMGGQIMGAWSKFVQKKTPGVGIARQFIAQRAKDSERKTSERAAKLRAGLGKVPALGRLSGYRSKLERQTAWQRQDKAAIADKEKLLEDLSTDDLKKRSMKNYGRRDNLATMRVLSSRAGGLQDTLYEEDGSLVNEEKQAMFRRHEQLADQFITDKKFGDNMFKEQPAALINYKTLKQEVATGIFGTKSPHEHNVKTMQALINAANVPDHAGHDSAIEAMQRYTPENMRILKQRAPATAAYLTQNHGGHLQAATLAELMGPQGGGQPQPPQPPREGPRTEMRPPGEGPNVGEA